MPFKIGWFSTGRDAEAIGLLDETLTAIETGELPLQISFIFCSREEGDDPNSDQFIAYCRKRRLPLIAFSSRRFETDLWRRGRTGDESALRIWRHRYHQQVDRLLQAHWSEVAVSLLAGYMLIVSDDFCEKHLLINLHPALPGGPKGTWQEVMMSLIQQRAREAGAQIHRVTSQLDSGPPVTYCRIPLWTPDLEPLWFQAEGILWKEGICGLPDAVKPLFDAIRQREFQREQPLIQVTLKKLAQGELQVRYDGIFYRGALCPKGLDVTQEVENLILSRRSHLASGCF